MHQHNRKRHHAKRSHKLTHRRKKRCHRCRRPHEHCICVKPKRPHRRRHHHHHHHHHPHHPHHPHRPPIKRESVYGVSFGSGSFDLGANSSVQLSLPVTIVEQDVFTSGNGLRTEHPGTYQITYAIEVLDPLPDDPKLKVELLIDNKVIDQMELASLQPGGYQSNTIEKRLGAGNEITLQLTSGGVPYNQLTVNYFLVLVQNP